jgi:hypothetical protein
MDSYFESYGTANDARGLKRILIGGDIRKQAHDKVLRNGFRRR